MKADLSQPGAPLQADQSSLAPFRPGVDGPWDHAAAAHLARRVGFGMAPEVLDRVLSSGPKATVAALIDGDEGDRWGASLSATARALGSLEAIQSWWVYQLLHSPNPLREKVALFWHGHFATSNRKVDEPRLMFRQLQLFREHGLGAFDALVPKVARDPAMIIWLDGNSNRLGRPNENFARELMELFTLGLGNYTEGDVKEAARAFTGWHVRNKRFWFNRRAHDKGEKRLFGRGGVDSGDDVIRRCVERRESARFVAAKLFRFFVHPQPRGDLVEHLGRELERQGRHIGAFLRTIFTSRLFFSPAVRRTIIGSPVDFSIGTLRTLNATASPSRLAGHLSDMGQDLLRPPSVKGWDGGRAWVGTTGLIARMRFCMHLTSGEANLKARVAWERLEIANGRSVLDRILQRLFVDELDGSVRTAISRSVRTKDPREILAVCLQLPEYQMV